MYYDPTGHEHEANHNNSSRALEEEVLGRRDYGDSDFAERYSNHRATEDYFAKKEAQKRSREKAERMEVPIMERSLIPERQTEGLAMEAISRMHLRRSQKPPMMEQIHLIISRRRMCRITSLVRVVSFLIKQEI